MTYDNFTIKAQEAILKGQQMAGALEQQQVDTSHLLRGIVEVDDRMSAFLFEKMGISLKPLIDKKTILNQ